MIDPSNDLPARLAAIVGASHVRGANEVALMDPGIAPENLQAGLAVRPANALEVSAILRICTEIGVGVVPQGGRTGLAGGAVSVPGQVLLQSERLDGGIEIDPIDRVATVSAGATLQALQEAALPYGLSPGIDIAARGTATIGGMISTNAGGMEAFRFGMMRDRLLGLEGVLANGTLVSDMARVSKANEGYDLKQFFCGTEGTLGIVTKAVLRLERAENQRQTALLGVASAANAIHIMRALQDRGTLLLVEVMWARYAHLIAKALGLQSLLKFCDAPIYLVVDISEEMEPLAEALGSLADQGLMLDAVLAQNARERDEIWCIREDTLAADREIPNPIWFDISVPVSHLDAYMAKLESRLNQLDPGNRLFAIGHLADGNLHLTISKATPYAADAHEAVCRAVESGLKAIGGAISAEHGIGSYKVAAFARNAPPGNLQAMWAMKSAFDPMGILNPGKVLPALNGAGPA